jgi:hypothetical protein
MTVGDAERVKGRGKRRRRQKDHHFMDVALDGYIRDQALRLWRDVQVYRSRSDAAPASALAQAGFFADKLAYAALWSAHWERGVLPAAGLPDGELYSHIEAAVRAAVLEEREARMRNGDKPLEDLEEYNEFIRHTLNLLLTDDPAGRKGPG